MIHYLDLISALLPLNPNYSWDSHWPLSKDLPDFDGFVDRTVKDVLFQVDIAGKWKFLSPDWSQLSGFKLEESLGLSFLDFICLNDRRVVHNLFQQLISGHQTSFRINTRLRVKDSDYRYVEICACLLLSDRQKVVGMTGTLTEVAGRKSELWSKSSLSCSNRHLENFFQSLSFPASIIEPFDTDILFLYTNKAAEDFYTLFPEQENQRFARRLGIPQHYIYPLLEYCHRSQQSGLPTQFEIKYENGTESKWLAHTVCPLGRTASGKPMFSFTAIDITESKQTVETLVASEARYRSVLEALTEYVHCCSPDYKFTFANHAYCQFRQKSSDELIGIGIFDDVSPEDRELVRKHFDSLTLEKPIAVGENRTVSPEGQVHWHQWIDRAIFNERGKLVEIQSVGRDITDRKRSEETLKLLNSELEQRTSELQKALEFDALLKRIIDQMRDSLDESQILNVVVRELGQALGAEYCNTALYDNGKIIFESLHEYSRSKAPINLIQIALADFPRAYYQVLQGKNACFCWAQQSAVQQPQSRYSVLVSPIVDDRGVLGNLRIFKQADRIYEPSELRLVEQVSTHCAIAIRQARLFQAAQAQVQELERLNIMKDDFLSTVSHELRTPITSMKMAIQMLKVSDSEEKRQRYLAALESECQREANLVNDLLDLQRLQSGASPLEITEINLQAWIPKLVKSFTPRIEQRQQQLDITINPSIAPLRTDEKSLHRILAELVNNACKYTPDGGSISVVADTSVDSWGLISVSNSGAEISPAEIERIFDKFYRIPSGDPWKQGGTGLGLALIAQLVDHLGGSIEVCSEDGQVTFSVRLPSNK